jgi:TIR domain
VPGHYGAFMSYARFDDQHDDGQLTQFRERLSAEVRVQTGEEFPIFQDRNDIVWGQNWQRRIDQTLDAVTLLLVIITPSFFRSHACRAEVERFLARERELGRDDLILPVYYVSTPELEDPARRETDELARVLALRQFADWRELRFKSFTSVAVRRAIAQLATRMRDSFWRLPADKAADRGDAGDSAAPLAERAQRVSPAIATVNTGQPNWVIGPYQEKSPTEPSAVIETEASKGTETLGRHARPVSGRTVLRPDFKALLLIRSLHGPSAKRIRIYYYISLAWAVVWAVAGIDVIVTQFSVGSLIADLLVIFLGSVLIPWRLYKRVIKFDRQAQDAGHPQRSA